MTRRGPPLDVDEGMVGPRYGLLKSRLNTVTRGSLVGREPDAHGQSTARQSIARAGWSGAGPSEARAIFRPTVHRPDDFSGERHAGPAWARWPGASPSEARASFRPAIHRPDGIGGEHHAGSAWAR